MPPLTVQDVMRLALPEGVVITAGSAGLSHQVSWVATPRATSPVFTNLRGGEFVLVATSALHALDERLTLANLTERLAQVPISAIAVHGDISDQRAQPLRHCACRCSIFPIPATSARSNGKCNA